MTAKQYLMQLKRIDTQLRQIENEIERLESELTSTTIMPKDVDVITSLSPDLMGDKIATIVDLQNRARFKSRYS